MLTPEVFESHSQPCEGVAPGVIAPFQGRPLMASLTVYTNGSREVGCTLLNVDTKTCKAAAILGINEQLPCIQLFPVEVKGPRIIAVDTPIGRLVYDTEFRILRQSPTLPDGHDPIELSAGRGTLLECLIREHGHVVSRNLLGRALTHDRDFPVGYSNVLSVGIKELRAILGDKNQQLIKTIRAGGYYIPRIDEGKYTVAQLEEDRTVLL